MQANLLNTQKQFYFVMILMYVYGIWLIGGIHVELVLYMCQSWVEIEHYSIVYFDHVTMFEMRRTLIAQNFR